MTDHRSTAAPELDCPGPSHGHSHPQHANKYLSFCSKEIRHVTMYNVMPDILSPLNPLTYLAVSCPSVHIQKSKLKSHKVLKVMSHCKCPCKKSNLLSIVHVQLQALPSSQYREKYLNGPDRTLHNMQAQLGLAYMLVPRQLLQLGDNQGCYVFSS